MSSCIFSKQVGDSDMTLLKDGLTIKLPHAQAPHEYPLHKESSSSLMDTQTRILLFDTSLRISSDLTSYAKT